MAVSGAAGWSTVAKLSPLLRLCGLVLGLAIGCGSRTSMLDQEGFVARGGDGATGRGGAGNQAGNSVGGNDPGGVNPQVAELPCRRYCMGYEVACRADLGGRDCVTTCIAEANSKDQACQAAAIGVLDCFTPFFTPGQDCESTTARGGAACGNQLARYNKCMGGTNNRPMMPSDPAPQRECQSVVSNVGSESCFEVLTCPSGDYVVECSPSGNGGKRCSCSWPTGSETYEYALVSDACRQAQSDCGID